MNNYLVVPNRHQVGFIPDDTEYRAKQGLMSQQLANACHSVGLAGTKWSPMYPVHQPDVSYAPTPFKPWTQSPADNPYKNTGPSGPPPDNCPCLLYVKAP